MTERSLPPLHALWSSVAERLVFLPPLPAHIDPLALFSLLLVLGLLLGEWLHARAGWPKIVGYVLAGTAFGPAGFGWLSGEPLAQLRPIADAALGLMMMEVGRRLDLAWLRRTRELLRSTLGDIGLSFAAIFAFASWQIGQSPGWAAATAAVTMASAPAVVLLAVEDGKAQGQVTERIFLHTALSAAASFVAFAFVLGFVHAEQREGWLNAALHPLWVSAGGLAVGGLGARLALLVARRLPKGSLAQVFALVACALLAVGIARMLAVPVFLTLFLMGTLLSTMDWQQTLRYASLPEGHWLLAIILFVIVGAALPWRDFTWQTGLQALGLIGVRAVAKFAALLLAGGSLPWRKRLLVGVGIQPLSATAVFMAYEILNLYPEIARPALALPLFAAAIMELAGPALCQFALRRAGECEAGQAAKGGPA